MSNFLADQSVLLVFALFIVYQAQAFWSRLFATKRSNNDRAFMNSYIHLRRYRENPSQANFRRYMSPEERDKLGQALINLEEQRENSLHL